MKQVKEVEKKLAHKTQVKNLVVISDLYKPTQQPPSKLGFVLRTDSEEEKEKSPEHIRGLGETLSSNSLSLWKAPI
jgi:hypothetical protein